jgi:hypothetical protein
LVQVEYLFDSMIDSTHQRSRKPKERALNESSIVDCSELIDEQVRIMPQAAACRHAQAEWLGIFHEFGESTE